MSDSEYVLSAERLSSGNNRPAFNNLGTSGSELSSMGGTQPCPHVRVIGAGELRCVLSESVTPRQLSEAVALLRRCVADGRLESGLRGEIAVWLRENARET